MTPEEFKEKMQEIDDGAYGAEDGHIKADYLMCEVLEWLGYDEGVEIFRKMYKWYA